MSDSTNADDRHFIFQTLYPRPGEEDHRPLFLRKLRPRVEPRPTLTRDPGQPVPPRLLQARLEGVLRTVHAAPHGRRNDTLHWASCRVAEILTAGELTDPRGAADALATVALATGLEPREVWGTIRSGFDRYGVSL